VLKPLYTRVLCKTVDFVRESEQLEIPFPREKVQFVMEVVGRGEDCKYVQVGDIVIIPEYGGQFVNVLDEDDNLVQRFLIEEEDILAKLEDQDAA
jgi:co-chaperonin GroES (HSP10)